MIPIIRQVVACLLCLAGAIAFGWYGYHLGFGEGLCRFVLCVGLASFVTPFPDDLAHAMRRLNR
jgi:hypothetical protein